MQEALKKVTNGAIEPIEKSVTLCLKSQHVNLNGTWMWEMESPAVYCSDVMSFPEEFIGTRGIVHPDDLPKLNAALVLMEDKELVRLDFRIITTYGEVKAISGQRISIEEEKNKLPELIPGKEPWEEVLQILAKQRENDFLKLRNELTEYTERLHGIGSWLINKQSGQTWYSDNVFRIYGLAPQTLNVHANTFNHFIHKDDRVAVLDAFEKAYEDHTPLHIEYRIVLHDDEIRFIQQITKWLYSADGQNILSGIVRDVTGERAVADELLATQSQSLMYQQVLKISDQQASTGFWLMNLATRKTSYSENYYRIYGFKQPFLPNYNSFLNLVHSDDRKKVKELVDKMYNEHTLPETEFRIVRPDGKQRYLKQGGKLFISPNKDLYMIGVVQDITAQKNLEKKILELNEKISLNNAVTELMEHLVETASFIWLPDGYMQWSDGFYKMLGYRPGGIEPLPRVLYKNIYPDDLKTFKDAEILLLNQQNHEDIVIRLISKNGIRRVRISFQQLNSGKDATIALVHDISKQTEINEQFSESKLFAELLQDSVNDMIIFTNPDNTIIHWNKTAEEKTGIKKDDALYHNLFEILPRLNEEGFLGQLHFVTKGNEAHSSRVHDVYFKASHDYWLCPLKNEAGEVTGILHVIHDVSKQLELQQQLNERLNFIESLVEFSVDRIVVLDRFMNYLYWNRKAENYYAINKERVLGKNILEIFPAFRNNPSYQQFRIVLRGETVYLPPVVSEDNDEYFETYLIPIKDDTGDVTAVLWIVHDLTKQQKAELEIRENKEVLQSVFDASVNPIAYHKAIRDEAGKIVDFNFQLANHEASKYSGDQTGKTYLEVYPAIKDTIIFEKYCEVVETGNKLNIEVEVPIRGNNFWFHLMAVKLDDGLVATAADITERKKAEREILQLKDEIAQKAADKYYSIFNSIDEGIAIIEAEMNDEGKITDLYFREVNPVYEKYTGLLNVVGKTVREVLPQIENDWLNLFAEVIRTGNSVRLENYSRDVNRWFNAYFSRVGETNYVAVVFNDITQRKKDEEALRHSEENYRSLFNSIDEGFAMCELVKNERGEVIDYRFIDINPAFEKHMNMRRSDVVGRLRNEVLVPDKAALDMYAGVVFSNKQLRKEFYSKNTNQWYDVSVFPRGGNKFAVIFDNITERKTVEEKIKDFNAELEQEISDRTQELQKQLTLLRYTEYLAQSGSWEYEIESGDFRWSEGMYKMFGLPQQMKVLPETYLELVIEEDRYIAKKIVRHLKKRHDPFEEIIRTKQNNEIRTIKVKASVIHEKGKAKKMIGVDVDVTDVKKAEEKLKQSERWLEQTAKASPDSITIYDLRKKQPIYLNECLSDWLGICGEELVNMGIEGRLKLVHPDDRLKLLHFNGKLAETENDDVLTLEYRIQTDDGETVWLRNRSRVFQRDDKGSVTHVLSILQNVTEEIALRDELKRRIQFAETILDSSTNRITVFDRSYRFIAWNKRCEEIHGVTRDKVIGKTIFEMFPGVEKHEVFMNAQEQSLNGEYVHVPYVQDGYTGAYLELFYVPLKNDAGETYAVLNIMNDVTRFVRNAEELDALNKQLETKNIELEQKNEEITSFAFVASHDMKEPLRKIHTFSDWLMEQEQDRLSAKGHSLVEKINSSVHRMELLIEDVLILTKIHSDPHKEESVELDKILKQVMDDMSEQIRETSAIVHAGRLPAIKANANQAFYLFKNLMSNAIKFQKPGSVPEITITSEIVKGDELKINLPREYLKLSFADNGFGFDQKYSKKIFQVFQRLHGKHEFGGTGIGLAICKKIMENHNGMINVISEVGKGSVFNCFFPLH